MEASNAEASIPQENRLTPQLLTYKSLNGVEVHAAKFNVEMSNPKKAVVYLMGWPWTAKDETTQNFPAQLAENLETTCFSIDTADSKETLDRQGEAVRQFLIENGIEEVTFVAHSMGAVKAAHAVFALQQASPEVKINGLVLIDPMGLEKRWTAGLAKDLALDAGLVAPKERGISGVAAGPKKGPAIEAVTPAVVAKEFLGNLLRIVKTDKLGVPLLLSQRKGLTSKDPIYSKLGSVPVWIIAGGKDKVSNYKGYLGQDNGTAKPTQEEMQRLAKVRSDIARQRHFSPETPVKVTVTGRHADHGGIVAIRGEQTARVIAGMLGKLKK